MLEGAPSNCRPPWLDTTIASAPCCTAFSASSAVIMPLIISLPPHKSLIRATSSQLKRGSNCSAVHENRDELSCTFFACPMILRNVRRSVCSMCQHHSGLHNKFSRFNKVGFGGADRPFLMSLCRCPKICKSAVSTNAEHLASLARVIRFCINSRSRIT